MIKKFFGSVLAVAVMLPVAASAASISNVEFGNGDVTMQGKAGESVSGKVRIVVNNNEEVEFVQFDVISDNLAPVCVDTGRLQEGTHWVNIPGDVKFPPNTGTYSLQVTAHGIFGGMAADDCVGDQVGSQSFGSSVRTVGGSSSVGSGSTSVTDLLAMIKDLMKQIADLKNPATPTKPAWCASVVAYTGFNASAAQASLLATPVASVFHAAGVYAPTGYFGPVSSNAAAQAAAQCK